MNQIQNQDADTQSQTKARNLSARFRTHKRLVISLGVIAAVIVLFGLLGYYWLPGYAKSQLELRLSELLQRPVTVQSIEIKPYTLELTVSGFQIGEKAGNIDAAKTFASFDSLYVDISAESIIQRAPVITTLLLDGPRFHLSRESEDTFNISDLIEKFLQQPEDKDEEEKAVLFSVRNIILNDGHIEWSDHFRHNHQEISEINFAIPFVANFGEVKGNWIEPYFSARINDAPFSLEGKLRPFTDKREAALAFNFKNINLTNIDEYARLPDGIQLLSGYLDSDLVLIFAQSNEGSTTITLTGETALRQVSVKNQSVQEPYLFDLGDLHLSLNQFDLTGQEPSHLVLSLNYLSLTPLPFRADKKDAALSLQRLFVDDLTLDLSKQQVVLNIVTLDSLTSIINREKDGSIDLAKFFAPSNGIVAVVSTPKPRRKPSQEVYEEWLQLASNLKAMPETSPDVAPVIPLPGRKPSYEEWLALAAQAKEKRADEQDTAWTVLVNQLVLNAAAIQYDDLSLTDAAPMVINPLDLTIENIDISGVKPIDINLTAQVNQYGSIITNGSLAWSPLAADLNLTLKAVDLVSLQGWANDALNVLLTSGNISFQGTVKADGEPLKVAVNGQGQLGDFNIFDQKNSRDLLRWKTLDVDGIDFVNDPLKVAIDSIKLDRFFARVMLLPDGELNLAQIVRQDETAAQAPVNGQAQVEDESVQSSEPLPIYIGEIVLEQGNIDFNDRFVQPNYRANLTGLNGSIGPIHTGRSGSIDIKGAIDRSAPLEIHGSIEPLGSELLLDISAKAKGIDLPQFTPYSGKYVGYAIEKGKLSVDTHYHVEQGVLTAENNVFLDQFTLGERIESEGAVSVPLKLAIALLKNRQGEIDIHLPIQGSINDPQFSLGSIILDAFINLITKAVTAPFALLGSMLGDGEELSEITFEPGYATINSEAESRLQALSQVLKKRPALQLEIAGHIDPVKDYEGLEHAILERKIKAQKLSTEAKEGKTGGSLEDVKLTSDEYSKYLEAVYKEEDFEKPKNFFGLTKSLPDEEMKQLLLEHIEVSDDDLQELAQDRAVAAQNWLLERGEIAGDRVFVIDEQKAKSEENEMGSRVEFILK